ncbi:MAG: hypothetical protein ABI963_08025 [Rhizomicrobium sp.]
MPAKKTSKSPAKIKSAAKPAAKPAAKSVAAKPAAAKAVAPIEPKPAAPETANSAPTVKPVAKGKPQIPGKPEPSWAKFNQGGHAQKMSKGRPFRHQGR